MAKNKKIMLSILRQSKAMSKRELAAEIGVTPACISHYESGKREPTLENALKIANFFDVSVDKIQFNCKE